LNPSREQIDMSKRTKRIVIWSLLGAALVALALPKLMNGSDGSSGAHAGASAKRAGRADARGASGARGAGRSGGAAGPVSVRAVIVSTGSLDDDLRVTGTLLPNEQVDLQSETSGKIVGIYFREGELVATGKLLVKINDSELRAQLKRAVYRRTLAAAKEARTKQLLEKNAVSAADYDVAINELNTANADIELIQAQLAKTELRAPFAGTIGFRQVSLGSYISPTTRIATLSSTDPVKVEFYVPERYASAVRPGSAVTFSVDEGDAVDGRVYAIEPRIDQTTRTLQVRATASNPSGRLRPGSFAEITVRLSRQAQAITVPSEAVVPQTGGKAAVFVAASGKAEQRSVGVGIRTNRVVQITSGLAPGDTVIYSGTQMMKPGADVKVTAIDDGGTAL
jgi:membrane fusion protein (multidrug efflux system)